MAEIPGPDLGLGSAKRFRHQNGIDPSAWSCIIVLATTRFLPAGACVKRSGRGIGFRDLEKRPLRPALCRFVFKGAEAGHAEPLFLMVRINGDRQ